MDIYRRLSGGDERALLPYHRDWRECNKQPCGVDCEGYWAEWGTCSKECGGGTQVKRFIIAVQPKHSGRPCAFSHGIGTFRIN